MNLQPTPTKDASWVRQSFLVTADQLQAVDLQNRTFTTASLKFTDTTLGGNFAINPPPQFTRTADPKAVYINPKDPTKKVFSAAYADSSGQGRYYSEAIDDNSQVIHMRFGVPAFNSLTTFFTGFYNTGAGKLARTGRATGLFYQLGQAAGFIVSILSWKLLAVHLLGEMARFFLQKPSSKFYYLKPAMPLYWNAVQTMVNQLAVNRGIIPRLGGTDQNDLNNKFEWNAAATTTMHNALPSVFRANGGIDVYSVAGRAQRLARKRHKIIESTLNNASAMNLTKSMDDLSKQIQGIVTGTPLVDTGADFLKYLSSWTNNTVQSNPQPGSSGADAETVPKSPTPPSGSTAAADNTQSQGADAPSTDDGFWNFLKGELDDGSAFVSFRVNSTGHVGESFSSQVGESELAQKINGMSSASRSTKFTFAGGNFDDGIIGKTIGGIVGAVGDTVSGLASGLGISGIAALGGSAFVDIPKTWQSSSANLPRSTYTIELRSPYGNAMSQLQNLYIPLCMLLAGVLPLSTGKQSYTSPFLCELYDKGRCQSRLGMIEQMSITRGVGNLGFDNDGHAMGIDVSFSIVDMSSIVAMPITQGFSLSATETGAAIGGVVGGVGGAAAGGAPGAVAGTVGGTAAGAGVGSVIDGAANVATAIAGIFDEDNSFTDYLAVVAGMNLADQIYQFRKVRLNIARTMANFDSWYSTSHYAQFVGDGWPAKAVGALFKGTART